MNPFPYRPAGKDGFFTGIPNRAQWIELTTVRTNLGFGQFTHKRNNPLLLKIDSALDDYHQSAGVGFEPKLESAAAIQTRARILLLRLTSVTEACMTWVVDKKEEKTSIRRRMVLNLHKESMEACNKLCDELQWRPKNAPPLSTRHNATPEARLRGQLRLQMLKEGFGGLGKGKRLHDTYWKETNIGGSNAHHFQGHDLTKSWEGSNDRFLFDHVRRLNQDALTKVQYVEPEDRWKYELLFDRDGLVHKSQNPDYVLGDLVDVEGAIFIVDLEGRCYSTLIPAKKGLVYHHSSIPSGQGVLFAGGIVIKNGVVKEVDNMSGHYRPGRQAMLKGLEVLAKNGVDLKQVKLTYMSGMFYVDNDDHSMGAFPGGYSYKNAYVFLEMKGFCQHESSFGNPTGHPA